MGRLLLMLLPLIFAGAVTFIYKAHYARLLADSVQSNNYATVVRSLQHGADPNAICSQYGHHPLSALIDILDNDACPRPLIFDATVNAAITSDTRILRALLRYGANPNVRVVYSFQAEPSVDCYPITCFEVLDDRVNWMVVRMLVEAGADPRAQRSSILWDAIRERNYTMCTWLLDHGADVTGDRSNYPLRCAVENLDVTMVKLLLSRGAQFSSFETGQPNEPSTWAQLADKNCANCPEQWRAVMSIIKSQTSRSTVGEILRRTSTNPNMISLKSRLRLVKWKCLHSSRPLAALADDCVQLYACTVLLSILMLGTRKPPFSGTAEPGAAPCSGQWRHDKPYLRCRRP